MSPLAETPPELLILFLHLPKTGGSTLRSIVRRQCRPEALYEVHLPHATPAELEAFGRTVSDDGAIIQGHFRFGLHQFLPHECTYITLVRDPVDRLISNYYHALRDPSLEPHHRAIRFEGVALREWASGRRFPWVTNLQTRRLSGPGPSGDVCSEAMLEMAKRNLRERFAVVGTTERFDETMVLLKRTFGWRSVLYAPKNAGTNRPSKGSIDSDTLRAIEDANHFDIELYKHAQGILDEHLARQGLAFEMELAAFKRVNRRYAGESDSLL